MKTIKRAVKKVLSPVQKKRKMRKDEKFLCHLSMINSMGEVELRRLHKNNPDFVIKVTELISSMLKVQIFRQFDLKLKNADIAAMGLACVNTVVTYRKDYNRLKRLKLI